MGELLPMWLHFMCALQRQPHVLVLAGLMIHCHQINAQSKTMIGYGPEDSQFVLELT